MIDRVDILGHLKKQGYVEVENIKTPPALLWQPDLIVSKGIIKYYILFRSSNTILSTFFNRISNSSSTYNTIIVFEKKCIKKEEVEILSLGISVGYFISGKLTLKLRNQAKSLEKEVKEKLQVIDIFVSSKQDILERKFVEDRVETLRKTNFYPFNPPHLIEYERFDLNDLYGYIDSVLDECDWIIIVLEDDYSRVVKYEIGRSIEKLSHENIFIFVKSSIACNTSWTEELEYIRNLETKSIKYIQYIDLRDLEVVMCRAIHLRMAEIYKKQKIKTMK